MHRCRSPEYGCFAPFGAVQGSNTIFEVCPSSLKGELVDCGYELSQVRWGVQTLLRLHERYELGAPAEVDWWRQLLAKVLAPLPSDHATGYRLSAGCIFACPHRHFSHLLGLYDLETEDPRTATALRSIDWYHHLTCNSSNWHNEACRGYSVCGIAGMSAVAARPAAAQGNLTRSIERIITPNGLYGEMEEFNHPENFGPTGESSYCLSGVLHTMLLHTRLGDGLLQLFPGLADWDAAFFQLRAKGGLLVSAKRLGNSTQFVEVLCLPMSPLYEPPPPCNVSLSVPCWSGVQIGVQPPSTKVVSQPGGVRRLTVPFNTSVVLFAPGVAPPFEIQPLPSTVTQEHFFGYNRRFPAQM
eukprot:COSAG01_NODE_11117_length_2004_cov_1.414173_2_plen_356_part_00